MRSLAAKCCGLVSVDVYPITEMAIDDFGSELGPFEHVFEVAFTTEGEEVALLLDEPNAEELLAVLAEQAEHIDCPECWQHLYEKEGSGV